LNDVILQVGIGPVTSPLLKLDSYYLRQKM